MRKSVISSGRPTATTCPCGGESQVMLCDEVLVCEECEGKSVCRPSKSVAVSRYCLFHCPQGAATVLTDLEDPKMLKAEDTEPPFVRKMRRRTTSGMPTKVVAETARPLSVALHQCIALGHNVAKAACTVWKSAPSLGNHKCVTAEPSNGRGHGSASSVSNTCVLMGLSQLVAGPPRDTTGTNCVLSADG